MVFANPLPQYTNSILSTDADAFDTDDATHAEYSSNSGSLCFADASPHVVTVNENTEDGSFIEGTSNINDSSDPSDNSQLKIVQGSRSYCPQSPQMQHEIPSSPHILPGLIPQTPPAKEKKQTNDLHKRCTADEYYFLQLDCGGPEVNDRATNVVIAVLKCVFGKSSH